MVSLSLEVKMQIFACGTEVSNKRNSKDMMILFADLLKFLLSKVLHHVQMTKLLNFGLWMANFYRKTKVIQVLSSE